MNIEKIILFLISEFNFAIETRQSIGIQNKAYSLEMKLTLSVFRMNFNYA